MEERGRETEIVMSLSRCASGYDVDECISRTDGHRFGTFVNDRSDASSISAQAPL